MLKAIHQLSTTNSAPRTQHQVLACCVAAAKISGNGEAKAIHIIKMGLV